MPVRKSKITFFIILSLSLFAGLAHAQVVVERSKDKVVISGRPYYIHIVKKGETAYSISKAYYITVDELLNENPNASRGIKEGQSLRLPVVEAPAKQKPVAKVQRDESKYIYHKLMTGDTVFSLAKRFGVSEDEILQSNPGVEINKLAIGTEIAIPRREFTTTTQKLDVPQKEKEYISHRVEKGESVASIAEKYGITVRELRKENRGLIFPKVDDYIQIPVSRVEETAEIEKPPSDSVAVIVDSTEIRFVRPEGFTPVGELKGKYNLAILLPLYFSENAKRTELDSSQIVKGKPVYKIIKRPDTWIYPGTPRDPAGSLPFLELYQGILIAADTLRSKGLDINLYVYDISRDSTELKKLIDSGKLSDMDLIIGPVYSHNLAIVAKFADEKEIPVISPVPLRSNAILYNNPMVFMTNPSLEVAQEEISKKIRENYTGNFVFIHSDSTSSDPAVAAFKSMIFKELSEKTILEEIRFKELLFFSRSMLSNDSINRLEHALSDKSENLILIASEDPSVLSETLMDIHTLSKKYQVKVIGYPAMRDIRNLEPKLYFDLGIELYSPYWIDYSKPDVRKFLRTYRQKFLTEPPEESYAWQGYDIAYYFISGIAMHGRKFLRKPEIHFPDLLETEFEFLRTGEENGFENHKLFLIKFTPDMEVKLLDDNHLNQESEK